MSISELHALMLLERGFIRTIADTILENIEDWEFCHESSFLLCSISQYFENVSQYKDFFLQIKEFELVCALILNHSSSEIIIYNALRVTEIVIGFSGFVEFTEENLRPFFGLGILDTIGSLIKESRIDLIVQTCFRVLSFIRDECKIIIHSFIIHVAYYLGSYKIAKPEIADYLSELLDDTKVNRRNSFNYFEMDNRKQSKLF